MTHAAIGYVNSLPVQDLLAFGAENLETTILNAFDKELHFELKNEIRPYIKAHELISSIKGSHCQEKNFTELFECIGTVFKSEPESICSTLEVNDLPNFKEISSEISDERYGRLLCDHLTQVETRDRPITQKVDFHNGKIHLTLKPNQIDELQNIPYAFKLTLHFEDISTDAISIWNNFFRENKKRAKQVTEIYLNDTSLTLLGNLPSLQTLFLRQSNFSTPSLPAGLASYTFKQINMDDYTFSQDEQALHDLRCFQSISLKRTNVTLGQIKYLVKFLEKAEIYLQGSENIKRKEIENLYEQEQLHKKHVFLFCNSET